MNSQLLQIFARHNSKKSEKGREHLSALTAQLKDIVETLIDNLVDPEETPDFVRLLIVSDEFLSH